MRVSVTGVHENTGGRSQDFMRVRQALHHNEPHPQHLYFINIYLSTAWTRVYIMQHLGEGVELIHEITLR